MELLNEMLQDMENKQLVTEMDETLDQYKKLILLVESRTKKLLKTLPDDLVEKIIEIERRIEVIEKAKRLIKKLEDGGWDKAKVKRHKSNLSRNREALRKSMYSAKNKMAKIEDRINTLVSDEQVEDDTVVEFNLDPKEIGALRNVYSGRLTIDNASDASIETLSNLRDSGFVDKEFNITAKGKKALDYADRKRSARGSVSKPTPKRDFDDLGDLDDYDADDSF